MRQDEDFDVERKVTWLELFFDLVFVVVLSRLAHDLTNHTTWEGVANFTLQFAAVFWAWNAFTYYIERFESGGLENRAFVFAAMAAVAALAVWTEDGLGGHYGGFAAAYVATRMVNMAQWIRAGHHVRVFRPVAARFVAGFAVVLALLVAAGALDDAERRLVFALAIVVDILTPVLTVRHQRRLPQLSTSKFPERFGLFTIIVLGESVVGVIVGLSELNEAGHLGAAQIVSGGLALAVGIGLWWIYFDFIARRPPRPRFDAALAWVYLHLVTLAAITATGAAISVAIADSVESGLTDPVRYLLGGSLGVALMGFALLELTLDRRDDEPTHAAVSPAIKASVGATVVVAALLDAGWSATGFLVVIVAALTVPTTYGVVVWYAPSNRHQADDRIQPHESTS